ncbi:MAG: S-layer homology domain-containing protein [Firmicutes bacterium]|nr:S-layer homology domain-containing protein [Bacillota bacterium]
MRKLSKLLSLFLCLALLFAVSSAALAADAATPLQAAKTLTANNDGTYTISLSVTGRAESTSTYNLADVIVVLDLSNSMARDTYSYTEHATGRYGSVNGEYVRLYREEDSWFGTSYEALNNDNYAGIVYYRSGSGWFGQYRQYDGTRYTRQTSSRIAVAKDAVNALAQELLRNNSETNPAVRLSLITFGDRANEKISGTSDLSMFTGEVNKLNANAGGTNWQDALKQADGIETRENAAVYVIFVSDGNPTYYIRGNGELGGSGREDSSNVRTCYNNALPAAQAIVQHGKKLYGISAFGDADRMQSLVTDAGAPAGNYYEAADQAALLSVFANIGNEITNALGYKNVAFTDGLSGMTTALVETDPTGFTYSRAGGVYGSGTTWDNAPAAVYDSDAHTVTWDLGDMTLENGVTYTVSFTVWPDQDAFDLAADLNNGMKDYDDLTAEEKAQIVANSGGYGLKTNTGAEISYTQVQTKTTTERPEGYAEGQPAADGFIYTYDPDTGIYSGVKETDGTSEISAGNEIPLSYSSLTVKKEWADGNNAANTRPGSVKLQIKRDNAVYAEVTLTAASDWTGTVFVAPGIITGGKTLAPGHDYTVNETDVSGNYQFAGETFHPMIVDGVMQKTATDAAPVTATNTLLGGFEIRKTVTAAAGINPPADASFSIKIAFKQGNDDWSGGKYAIRSDTYQSDPADIPANGVIRLKAGQTAMISGVPLGVAYTVTEQDLPAGFSLDAQASTGLTGSIAAVPSEPATLVNRYSQNDAPTGSLRVKKLLEGDGVDYDKAFTFTVTLDDDSVNGTFSGLTFRDGQTTFQLKGGQYKDVEGLPDGMGYIVNESDYDGYVCSHPNGVRGIINEDELQTATFVNSKNAGSTVLLLEVPFTKTVVQGGSAAPKAAAFTYEVFDFGFDPTNYQYTVTGLSVYTNGAGSFNGKIEIRVPQEFYREALGNISEGFYVREINGYAPRWQYDTTVWHVVPQLNAGGQIDALYFYNTSVPGSLDDQYARHMTFKNIYNYSPAENDDEWSLSLTKVDAADKRSTLSGAKFDLYRVDKIKEKKVGSFTTNKKGVIRVTVTQSGEYYWVETQPPTGYTLDTTKRYTSTKASESDIVVKNEKTETPPMLNDGDHFAYVIGYPDGLVHPQARITRAETATIFFRLLDENVRNANLRKDNSFRDVNLGNWYNTAVSTMSGLGIIKGYPNGQFKPNGFITRAEFAAIAARFDRTPSVYAASFTDIGGHWAKAEIGKAAANGWVNGYTDNTFKPDQYITRAEAMALINRVLNRNPESPADLLQDMIKWPDNMDTAKWYYLDVQEATNSHDYERKANHTERWTKINKAVDWAGLEL